MNLSTTRIALLIGLFLGLGAAFAQSIVDQGRPGRQGAWPVVIDGGVNVVVVGGDGGTNPTTVFNPTATTTSLSANATPCVTAGGASCTIILASIDMEVWPNVTITLQNTGANAITNANVEWSPDGTNFELWDTTTFAALAAAGQTSIAITGNSRRFLRIEARSAANTTAVVTLTATNG